MLTKAEKKLLHDEIVVGLRYKNWELMYDTVIGKNGERRFDALKLIPKYDEANSIIIEINYELSYSFRPEREEYVKSENYASSIIELFDKIKKFYKFKN